MSIGAEATAKKPFDKVILRAFDPIDDRKPFPPTPGGIGEPIPIRTKEKPLIQRAERNKGFIVTFLHPIGNHLPCPLALGTIRKMLTIGAKTDRYFVMCPVGTIRDSVPSIGLSRIH